MTFDEGRFGRLVLEEFKERDPELYLPWLRKEVSGTYRNDIPTVGGTILELRVDIDGRRPQERLSGDIYTQLSLCGIPVTFYSGSFIVDTVNESGDRYSITLSGAVRYYSQPTRTGDSIEVTIPRVGYFSHPAPASVRWLNGGSLVRSHLCPKISEYFRVADLEVDRFQGTSFPPTIDPDITPAASGLPGTISIRDAFLRAGIDLTVTHDDTLNDADSSDTGSNWSEAELHDLMENRFDSFSNRLQWNLYGVIVPRFGDPGYASGYYGTMFDWAGWQVGDSFLRQGFAIADEATRARTSGTLYDSAAKEDRLVLWTLIHEAGHAFNLPHAWERGIDDDAASESFMNYPWRYTGGGGGETNYWTNLLWEFDDVELRWMRHADRKDVIFGGRNWIGNNLSIDLNPAFSQPDQTASLEIIGPQVFDFGVPVELELKLENTTDHPLRLVDRLEPEDGLLRVFIQRPNGEIVEYVPPVRRLLGPPDIDELPPGGVAHGSIGLSFGAKGPQFGEPGSYQVRAFWPCYPFGFAATAMTRIRVAHPMTRASEELAHLLTSREAAQFLYYGGIRSHPRVRDQLLEASERFAGTDPMAVRHIAAALASDAARSYKHPEWKEGKRVVVATEPNLDRAMDLLSVAVEPLPENYGVRSAFNPMSESRLVDRLAAQALEVGHKKQATATLDSAVRRLEAEGAGHAAEILQRRSRNLKRRKT